MLEAQDRALWNRAQIDEAWRWSSARPAALLGLLPCARLRSRAAERTLPHGRPGHLAAAAPSRRPRPRIARAQGRATLAGAVSSSSAHAPRSRHRSRPCGARCGHAAAYEPLAERHRSRLDERILVMASSGRAMAKGDRSRARRLEPPTAQSAVGGDDAHRLRDRVLASALARAPADVRLERRAAQRPPRAACRRGRCPATRSADRRTRRR